MNGNSQINCELMVFDDNMLLATIRLNLSLNNINDLLYSKITVSKIIYENHVVVKLGWFQKQETYNEYSRAKKDFVFVVKNETFSYYREQLNSWIPL